MTANDHADCGSADSEFNSQVLLTLTGPVPQANEMNLGFGQLSLSVPAATMRTIPNPVSSIFDRRAIAEIGQAVYEATGGSMSDLLPVRTRPQEGRSDKEVNMMVPLDAVTISQLDLPVSTVSLGSVGLTVLAHDATGPRPGICSATARLAYNDPIQRTDSTKVRNFVESFVALDGQPVFHEVHSSTRVYFGWRADQ